MISLRANVRLLRSVDFEGVGISASDIEVGIAMSAALLIAPWARDGGLIGGPNAIVGLEATRVFSASDAEPVVM